MANRLLAGALGILGVILTLSTGAPVHSQGGVQADVGLFEQDALLGAHDPAFHQEGVEPLGRGPVHEAFAGPANNAAPEPTPIIPRRPPEPVEELPPQEKPAGDNVQWISGYWAWDEDARDFLWVSGTWRNIPPGRQWVPGHFKQVVGGWQWVPGFWAADDAQPEVIELPPPRPILEAEPPRPADNATFVPGNWVFRETRYVWRPGFWCAFRPGWVWVPAHYVWTPCGFVFVDGYWDYPLHQRGLLFAPCMISPRLTVGVGVNFCFTPRWVINDRCLMGALFVRPRCGSYFFGDYFDARYQQLGFVSWTQFRIGRAGCDPLFGYYRAHHCNDPRWERNLCDLYQGRFLGSVARPPINLVQQNTLINNIQVNKLTNVNNITNVNNVAMIAPVTKVNNNVVRLQKLEGDRLQDERRQSDRLRELGQQRAQQEALLLAKRGSAADGQQAARSLKLDLPSNAKAGNSSKSASKAPPPLPIVVKSDDRGPLDTLRSKDGAGKKLDGVIGNSGNQARLPEAKLPDAKGKDGRLELPKPNANLPLKPLDAQRGAGQKAGPQIKPGNGITVQEPAALGNRKADPPKILGNTGKPIELKNLGDKKPEVFKGNVNPVKPPEVKRFEGPKSELPRLGNGSFPGNAGGNGKGNGNALNGNKSFDFKPQNFAPQGGGKAPQLRNFDSGRSAPSFKLPAQGGNKFGGGNGNGNGSGNGKGNGNGSGKGNGKGGR